MFTRKASGAAPASDDPVQAARTRARQRLVGAAVLLVVGVIAFPLLFETKPRPLPLDTPIVSARAPMGAQPAGGGTPAAAPAGPATPAAASATQAAAASAPTETVAPVEPAAPPPEPAASAVRTAQPGPAPVKAAPASAPAPAAAEAGPSAKVATTAPSAQAMPVATPAPASPAAAAAAANTPPAAASAPRTARYVVQVGAFSEAATAREVRLKVEKLGLKTYTQVVEVDGAKRTRVRVGPFASREEAMQTLGRIQAANLPGVVLAL